MNLFTLVRFCYFGSCSNFISELFENCFIVGSLCYFAGGVTGLYSRYVLNLVNISNKIQAASK